MIAENNLWIVYTKKEKQNIKENMMKAKPKPIINNHLGELPAVSFRRVESVAGFNISEFELEVKGSTTQEALEGFDLMIELIKRIKK